MSELGTPVPGVTSNVRDDGTTELQIDPSSLPPLVARLLKSGTLGTRFDIHSPADAVLVTTVQEALTGEPLAPDFQVFFTPALETHTIIEASPTISENGWAFTRDMLPSERGVLLWEAYEPLSYMGFVWAVNDDDEVVFHFLSSEVFPVTVPVINFIVPLGAGVKELQAHVDTDQDAAFVFADAAFAFLTAIADRNAFQTVAAQQFAPGQKPSKKAAKRATAGQRPVVNGRTVVTVNVHPRATQGAAQGTLASSGGGKHRFMYWVGSFKRNQWYPSEQVHREVQVIGHFRGVRAPTTKQVVNRVNL